MFSKLAVVFLLTTAVLAAPVDEPSNDPTSAAIAGVPDKATCTPQCCGTVYDVLSKEAQQVALRFNVHFNGKNGLMGMGCSPVSEDVVCQSDKYVCCTKGLFNGGMQTGCVRPSVIDTEPEVDPELEVDPVPSNDVPLVGTR